MRHFHTKSIHPGIGLPICTVIRAVFLTLICYSIIPSALAQDGATNTTTHTLDNTGEQGTFTGPVVICQPLTVHLQNGVAMVPIGALDGGSYSQVPISSRSATPNRFTRADKGVQNVVLTVTDVNGNSSTCLTTVNVVDGPVQAVCKAAIVYVQPGLTAGLNAESVDGGSYSECKILGMMLSKNTFGMDDLGLNQVTLTVKDECGNVDSCVATVNVVQQGVTGPTAVCKPATIYLNANGVATVSATQVNNGSYGGSRGLKSWVLSKTSFSCANIGANSVTLTVTDSAGLTDECVATVTVADNTQPVAVCKNVTLPLVNGVASITGTSIDGGSTDNCGIVSRTASKTSFTTANVGANNVVLTVKDASGNSATCNAVVTVTAPVSGPTAVCKPATIYLNANGVATVSATQVNNGSYGGSRGIKSWVLSKTSFSCANIGANSVTLTVTDSAGLTDECVATVTVADNTQPVAVCKNITLPLVNGAASITGTSIDGGSTDNCGIASRTASKTSFTTANVGANNVVLTVKDAAGNSATCNAVVTVTAPVTGPTAVCKPATIYLNANGVATVSATQVNNGSYGGSRGIKSWVLSKTSFNCSNIGANSVTLTVTDSAGLTDECVATVTVADNTQPVAVCKNITLPLVNGVASITGASIDGGSTDNCGIASRTASKTSFTTANVGANNVVLTVKDASGNSATCTAVVTVTAPVSTNCDIFACSITSIPTQGPVIGGADPNVIYIGYGSQSTKLSVSVTGTNAPVSYSWSPDNHLSCTNCAAPVFTPKAQGSYTFTVTVSSGGCTSTCTVTICVLDIRAGGGHDDDDDHDGLVSSSGSNIHSRDDGDDDDQGGDDDDNGGDGKKVYICHVPPGNPGNAHTIAVSVNAVSAHLNNHAGDKLGRCGQSCNSAKDDEASIPLLIPSGDHKFDLLVYPNPFVNQFHMRVETGSDKPVEMKLYDIQGKLMLQRSNVNINEDILLGETVAAGVYFINVTQGDSYRTIRMTKSE